MWTNDGVFDGMSPDVFELGPSLRHDRQP